MRGIRINPNRTKSYTADKGNIMAIKNTYCIEMKPRPVAVRHSTSLQQG